MAVNTQEPHSPLYKTQGATALVVSSGAEIQITSGGEISLGAGASANFASGSVTLPGVLMKGFIDLPLTAGWEASSADSLNVLTSGTNPSYGRINAGTDPKARILWTSNAEKVQWDIMLPPDLSTAGGMTLNLYGEASGTPNTWGVDVRFGVGDADAGTTGALTSTPANASIAIASGNVIANGPMSIAVGPTSASGLVRLYGARLVYTKLTS
jgi:hypothetical protein